MNRRVHVGRKQLSHIFKIAKQGKLRIIFKYIFENPQSLRIIVQPQLIDFYIFIEQELLIFLPKVYP